MSAKPAILSRLRSALHVTSDDAHRKAAVAERLGSAPIGIIPARAQISHKNQIDLFQTMAEKVGSTAVRVKSGKDVPSAVTQYLVSRNLPYRVIMGCDPRLAAMPWQASKNLELTTGASDGSHETSVTHAFGAVAETGTLVMTSASENPTTLNFLPENHIVIVNALNIKGYLEAILADIGSAYGKGLMPRTVNLITGPSRSGDIEQKILLGAHGPRALHVIVVG